MEKFLSEVERFGYAFGPSRKRSTRTSRDLVVRLGVCVAATMNVMLFSFSFYFGLSAQEAGTFELFSWASLALATVVVAVGAWPFFRAAHLGSAGASCISTCPSPWASRWLYALSVVQALQHRGDHAYLDTLCAFVTLMVLGRWLQQRVLDRNRRFLLEDDGVDALMVRRRTADTVSVVPAPQVAAGDLLLVAPGDLLCMDAVLTEPGSFSLDWITGEPQARSFPAGATVPAGAFNAGRSAVEARATQSFQESVLPALVSARAEGEGPTDAGAFLQPARPLVRRGGACAGRDGRRLVGRGWTAPLDRRGGRAAGGDVPVRPGHRHPARAGTGLRPAAAARSAGPPLGPAGPVAGLSVPSSSTRRAP